MHAPPALAVVLLALVPAAVPQQLDEEPPLVRAALLERDAVTAAGEPIQLALELAIEPGWHVYWTNPGDSGLPPTLALELPDGWTQGLFEWPLPKRHVEGALVTFVHEGTLVLPFTVTPPEDFASGTVEVTGTARWLVCEQICLAGDQSVAATLTVGEERRPGPAAKRVDTAREAAIQASDTVTVHRDWTHSGYLVLGIQGVNCGAPVAAAPEPDAWRLVFWPATEGVFDLSDSPFDVVAADGPDGNHTFAPRPTPKTLREGLPNGARGVLELRPQKEGGEPAAYWIEILPVGPGPSSEQIERHRPMR